jgi:hypothetical protein
MDVFGLPAPSIPSSIGTTASLPVQNHDLDDQNESKKLGTDWEDEILPRLVTDLPRKRRVMAKDSLENMHQGYVAELPVGMQEMTLQ